MYINKVLCEDSNELLSKIDSEFIDLILTDIPYGINYKSNKQNCDTRGPITIHKDRSEYFDKIQGDSDLPTLWLENAYRILKDKSAIYIFCHWSKWHELYPKVESVGFNIKNMIILNKSNHGMGDLKGSYAPKHEILLFAVKGRHLLNFPNGRANDVWNVPVRFSGSKRYHPNEKPLSWLTPCIENSSKENDVILDPFAGSGSTGIVAKKLNRNYILIDVDESYCSVAEKRLEEIK